MKNLLTFLCIVLSISIQAQVKIGNNPNTINANSLLELESTNKGFLPPRISINSATSVSPLTGTVPSGMMVYSSGGTLADGYYYWNGSSWKLVATNQLNAVAKTATATLAKTESFVLASNNITLTLPTITTSDNGLAITIKNIGSHTDLTVVKGNGSSKIDGKDSSTLTRWFGKTYIAYNGNWIKKEKEEGSVNLYEVSPNGSWTTIQEALDFLNAHMTGPSVIRLSGGGFDITSTLVINLPYPLTIQGLSYSKATLQAATGLTGSPMIQCLSECYFKMLAFDATTLTGYGNNTNEDAIQLFTPNEYYEVKDCTFDSFNKSILAKSNVEIWVFEVDIDNAKVAGIELAAGATSGVSLKISEVDFTSCAKGVHFLSGADATVSILNSTFYNASAGVGITYVPATFTTFSSMFIENNAWNNVGTFITGFDFTRTDGRDSKAFIQSNAGDPNRNPNCHINVLNSSTSTSISNGGSWYKASWDYTKTTVATTMWTVTNNSSTTNKITYQPTNSRSGWFIISGNLSSASPNRNISLGVVKNGNSSTRLGETTIRTGSGGTPSLFSTVVYLSGISANDYFELYVSDVSGGNSVIILDLQWYAETK